METIKAKMAPFFPALNGKRPKYNNNGERKQKRTYREKIVRRFGDHPYALRAMNQSLRDQEDYVSRCLKCGQDDCEDREKNLKCQQINWTCPYCPYDSSNPNCTIPHHVFWSCPRAVCAYCKINGHMIQICPYLQHKKTVQLKDNLQNGEDGYHHGPAKPIIIKPVPICPGMYKACAKPSADKVATIANN